MHSLLSPGIRLLGRFGFARKFQILFILFILPLAGSLWMIGLDYRDKLAVISSEKSGVSQLLTLDALDGQLTAQRNLASRWKALDLLREPTPAAKAAMDQVDANNPFILQSLQALGDALKKQARAAIPWPASMRCRQRSRGWMCNPCAPSAGGQTATTASPRR